MKYFARIFLALFVVILISPLWAYAQNKVSPTNVKEYIPPQAVHFYPLVTKSVYSLFTELDDQRPYFMALMEHESCITLQHSRCLNGKSKLSTKWDNGNQREEGANVGQLTRAWNKDGTIRLDVIADLRSRFNKQLKDLTWANVYERDDLVVDAMILLSRDNWLAFSDVKDDWGRLGMMDSAYNGGRRDVIRARTICNLTKGCNPDLWFDNVELWSPKSTKVLYANRSAKDINTHHVRDVLQTRLPKYKRAFDLLPEPKNP